MEKNLEFNPLIGLLTMYFADDSGEDIETVIEKVINKNLKTDLIQLISKFLNLPIKRRILIAEKYFIPHLPQGLTVSTTFPQNFLDTLPNEVINKDENFKRVFYGIEYIFNEIIRRSNHKEQ